MVCQVLVKCDFSWLSSRCTDKTSCVFGFKRADELLRILISQLVTEVHIN